jgi:transposase
MERYGRAHGMSTRLRPHESLASARRGVVLDMAEVVFAKLKDWRRVATRYDRCAHTFFSAICVAASVAFHLKE